MQNLKIRMLLQIIRGLSLHLNEQEINDIGKILFRAMDRLLKESEEKNGQANKK